MANRLPIHDIEDELVRRLATHRRLILQAPTGSGKSTQVPKMLLEHGLLGTGQCITLQPRRLAARMLASRVAQETGTPLGKTVGYQVRLESRRSADTRLLFETEGVLLRRMNDDPTLEGVTAVIFDEFHERHLYGDISLARVLDLQQTARPDLTLIVMSATIDTGPLAAYLKPVSVLTSEGRAFPVDVAYRAGRAAARGQRATPVWELAADAFAEESRRGISGNVLVFMPGAYEIRRTIESIGRRPESRRFRLAPLHGQIPPREQDAAVAASDEARIVVATNIAETSITIDGVDLVIDSGLHRILRYDPRRGINTLLVESISRASADQRAGRAGRTRPGRVVRLWSESEHGQRRAAEEPEIRRLDLSEVLLNLRAAGIDPAAFGWFEAPAPAAIVDAETLLTSLGALGRNRQITPLGRRMLAFPAHPRYSRMLLASDEHDCVQGACLVAALTQGRDLLISNPGPQVVEARNEAFGPRAVSDLWVRMRAFDVAVSARFRAEALEALGIHRGAAREVGPVYEQFLAIARNNGLDTAPGEFRFAALRRAILTGFSDRVGRRLGDHTLRCELTGGRRGTIDKTSTVDERLFVAADIREIGSRKGEAETAVGLLTAIETDWLHEMFPDDFSTSVDVWLDTVTNRVRAERRLRFRDLVLESDPVDAPPERTAEVLAAEVAAGRLKLPLWDHKVDEWVLRVNLVARECPELEIAPIGRDEQTTILEQLALGASGYKDLKDRPVLPAFRAWLSPPQIESVDAYAPERVSLTNGKTPRVVYASGEPPSISLRIQELFDVSTVPTIAMGRVTPVVKILAPNMRPVQVTTDLDRFWKEHYPEIRPALSRRYPKHEWR